MTRCTIAFLLAAILAGCQEQAGVYRLAHVEGAKIHLDGSIEPAWSKAATLTRFVEPWAGGEQPTTFRALVDGKTFYFAFECIDDNVKVSKEWNGETTLNEEDRVEIYFAIDDNLDRYYCIEIDSQGRVHDFEASLRRQRDKRFDSSWNMPGLKTRANPKLAPLSPPPKVAPGTVVDPVYKSVGYIVEGSIPLASLEGLGLPALTAGQSWRVGLFRADLGRAGPNSDRWITWIVPASEKPNFHTPSALGRFVGGRRCSCR